MKDSLKNLTENVLSKVDRSALDELFELGKLSDRDNSENDEIAQYGIDEYGSYNANPSR